MTAGSNNRRKDREDESGTARDTRRAAEHAKYIAEREEAMSTILRMILNVRQSWRRCPERNCRRGRCCSGGPDFACLAAMPPSRATEEEKNEAMSELHAALRVRVRELEVAKEQGHSADGATPTHPLLRPFRVRDRR